MPERMSRDKLRAKAKAVAASTGNDPQTVIRLYAIERFLARVSESSAAPKIVLKGGVLLGSLLGIAARPTKDMDATVMGIDLAGGEAHSLVSEIASFDLGDGMSFSVGDPSDIMGGRTYSGLRIPVTASCDRTRASFVVELSAGDPITPAPVDLRVFSVFGDDSLTVRAYPVATAAAEKIETVLSRGTASTRPRDSYDLLMMDRRLLGDTPDAELAEACRATMGARGTLRAADNWNATLDAIASDAGQLRQWERFVASHSYASGATLPECMAAAENICRRALGDPEPHAARNPAMTRVKIPEPTKAKSVSPAADERSARATSRSAASPRAGHPRRERSYL